MEMLLLLYKFTSMYLICFSSLSFILYGTKGIFHNKSHQLQPACYQVNELHTKSVHFKLLIMGKSWLEEERREQKHMGRSGGPGIIVQKANHKQENWEIQPKILF